MLDSLTVNTLRTWLLASVLVIAVIAGVAVSADLASIIALEARGAMDSDVLSYFYVSRGLLKGLTLYVDLYETKPPGIFLLGALSLLLTGDQRFLTMLSLVLYVAMPLVFVAFAALECRRRRAGRLWTGLAIASAFLLGTLLTLYTEERTGMLQTELWGAFAGSLFALIIAGGGDEDISRRRLLLASLAAFATLMMKEPFVLTLLAAGLVVCTTRKQFVRSCLMPIGLGGAGVVAMLLIFGWLWPYLTVHLPAMFSARIAADPLAPVWTRWIAVRWLYGNTTQFSPSAPQWGFLLILLFCGTPLERGLRVSGRWIALALIGILSGAAMLHAGDFVAILLRGWSLGLELEPAVMPLIRRMVWLWLTSSIVFATILVLHVRRGGALHLLLPLMGLALAAQAVGISVYTSNHFAFAVPFYATVIALFLRHIASPDRNPALVIAGCIAAAAVAGTYRTADVHVAHLRQWSAYTAAAQREVTAPLDALLDACGWDRYTSVSSFERFAFAQHAHMGPLVILRYFNYLPNEHPLKQQTLENILERTPLIVAPETVTEFVSPAMHPLIMARFTREAPPCAHDAAPIPGMQVLYRK